MGGHHPIIEGLNRIKRWKKSKCSLYAWAETSIFFCLQKSVVLVLELLNSDQDFIHHSPTLRPLNLGWIMYTTWRRKWQPTPVTLLGKSHGQRSLVDYSPRGHKESDTTERLIWSDLKQRNKRKKKKKKSKRIYRTSQKIRIINIFLELLLSESFPSLGVTIYFTSPP